MPNVINEVLDKDGNVLRRKVSFICEGESRTKQSMKDECDINNIMKRYERTGLITHLEKRQQYFADVSSVPDFAQAISVVDAAHKMFMSLPANIRKHFENDPAQYVEFCADPSNLEKMREMGIANPEPKPDVFKVEVVNQPTSGA